MCEQRLERSDAILIENFDPSYLVFERAGELRNAGLGRRMFVPTQPGSIPGESDLVSAGFVDVLTRAARLSEAPQMIPVREVEPVSLNVAYQVRAVLQKEHVQSVIVVSPGFRSRRSALVYGKVFGEAGIATYCVPVFAASTPDNWTRTWHGIQDVTEQYLKLQYYRFWVLRRLAH